ncbi:hypothetical protein GCM10007420_10990 [Glycocaulis albus]|uniref:Uncharacterized protein n=1 Tax=Glycocaulis albus TaxID=1382801 RepID=A0ABQ1XLP2_9PROT|nr:hypothetical protein GCM10007420_10990 [Glycocaulis albus]
MPNTADRKAVARTAKRMMMDVMSQMESEAGSAMIVWTNEIGPDRAHAKTAREDTRHGL